VDFDRYVEGLERRRERRGPENLVVLERATSTNALARAVIAEYQNEEQTLHPLLILALEQSGGRGRQGRTWSSPRGKGVYATRVVAVADPALLQTLPLLAGVGLCRALSPHLPAPCRLKWPNDLLVEAGGERKKIGGVLIEASVRPGHEALAIMGFGVNYLHGSADLPETATSLVLLGGGIVSLEDLTWDLVEGVETELTHLGDAAYAVQSYRDLSVHRSGERIVCRMGETTVEGAFLGFDEAGRLLLESRDGQRISVAAGEVIEE
jgi:BirA family transcriptional regulator, biotin operon repressor / biotin---[acetyl-CoA-carboxylase] ligase